MLKVIVTWWKLPPISVPAANCSLVSPDSVSPALVGEPGNAALWAPVVPLPITSLATLSFSGVPSSENVTFDAATEGLNWKRKV